MTQDEASLMQIRVLRDDDQTVFLGVLPYNRDRRPISNQHLAREAIQERDQQRAALVGAIGFHQREVSRGWYGNKLTLAVSGKSDARLQVLASEVGEIFKDLVFGHIRREIFEHLVDRNPQSSNAGLSAAFVRVNRDVIVIIHSLEVTSGLFTGSRARLTKPTHNARAKLPRDAGRDRP